jgi:peroxiredoxin
MVPGAIFPDYELSDHTGKHRKLSEMQGQHPMVLVLSRGGYCPKDRRQAEGLIQLHREIEVGYCRLVTISTDNITETNEYRGGVGAHWPFLSDVRRIVQKDLDIAEYTDPLHNPMILTWSSSSPVSSSTRSTTATGSLAGRPWKISARTCGPSPENAGRTGTSRRPNSRRRGSKAELFYPYGKTYIQTLGEQD